MTEDVVLLDAQHRPVGTMDKSQVHDDRENLALTGSDDSRLSPSLITIHNGILVVGHDAPIFGHFINAKSKIKRVE